MILKQLENDTVIIVADNLQITNRIIHQAIDDMNPEPIQDLVKACEKAGADAIDINSGPLPRDPEKRMSFLVETVQAMTELPTLLDTVNPRAIEAGLSVSKNKAIINGFSLEPTKLESILPLAKDYDADIIGYLLLPNSQVPTDESECLSVALELFGEFQKAGVAKERLIIDPVVAPLMWENGSIHNRAILSVLKTLPELLGFPVRTIAGLSNLTTGKVHKDKRSLLEKTFLPMLAASGLNMALLNVLHAETMRAAKASTLLMKSGIFTYEELDSGMAPN